MFEFARADVRALTSQEAGILGKVGVVAFNLGLHAVLFYRLARWCYLHHMQPLAHLISYFSSLVTGAQISPRAEIGKGLTIYHPQGIVIGAKAIIGNFCTLVHGNVVGQLYGGGDRPTIGDHFFAGTGAKILGRIRIGNNVQVGPNAVVINSLPNGVTVAVTPARVISKAGSDLQTENYGAVSRDVVLERLSVLLKVTLDGARPVDSITEATGLLGHGIGLDSIETLRLIGAIEEKFNITIDESELDVSVFRTVGSLVTFIQEMVCK